MAVEFSRGEKVNTGLYIATWLVFVITLFFPGKLSQYGGIVIMDVFLAFNSVFYIYQFLYPVKMRKPYHYLSMSLCIMTLFFFFMHFA